MSATFAHITLVDTLIMEGTKQERIDDLPVDIARALDTYVAFCELGAVSPDCPFLVFGDSNAHGWGNAMHYWKTGDFIRNAISMLPTLNPADMQRNRCIAWLFGYAAHLVTDLTIHPIVEKKVGAYETHALEHRVCEMHQDVYIFFKCKRQEITKAEYLQCCGIASCAGENRHLNSLISRIWQHALEEFRLQDIKMQSSGPSGRPDPSHWFECYVEVISRFAEEGKYVPLRFALENAGIVYPDYKNLDRDFIDNLATPSGQSLCYDDVFEKTLNNVMHSWSELAAAIEVNKPALFTLANGNLDTGKRDGTDQLIFPVNT